MHIGIDFGTSYCAAAALVDGRLTLIRFGEAEQLRTAVYFPEVVPHPDEFVLTPALAAQVDALMRAGRGADVQGSEEQRRRDAVRVVRRQWMEEQLRAASASVSVASFQHALFGEEAVDAYLEEGGGHLVESPKSMFGYRLDEHVRRVIVSIAAHMLEHIRLTAMRQLGVPVHGAVIGRPVEFRSSMGAAGGEQALALLREAAALAGFDAVSFLQEPTAAALHYHRSLAQRQQALIVDIGGGTTDLAHAELGGSEPPRILRSWGLPKGGTDLDVGINLHSFMPLFGKETIALPVHHYVDAASVHIPPQQRAFRQHDFRHADAPFGPRLRALQQPGATTRLNQQAEAVKLALGHAEHAQAALDFIEDELRAPVDRADFLLAAEPFLQRLRRLLQAAAADMPLPPQSLFVTGGSSRSPQVRECVRGCFPAVPLVHGDPSLGVVSGLAAAAAQA